MSREYYIQELIFLINILGDVIIETNLTIKSKINPETTDS